MLFEQLVEGCKLGDRRSQENLYKQLAPRLFGICIRYSMNRSEAEDLLQAGFVQVFRTIDRYKGEGTFEGWAIRIIVNHAIDQYRRRPKLHNVNTDEPEAMALAVDAQEPMDEEDLLKLILELPERYRLVFNMYAIEGYSHREIATKLNISEGTSKSQLSRARMWLRKKLEKEKVGF